MPAGYVIAGAASGQAAIVVRATSCEAVSIDQSPALSQIGITLFPVISNEALAKRFQIAGLPAVFDPQLTYEYTPAARQRRDCAVCLTTFAREDREDRISERSASLHLRGPVPVAEIGPASARTTSQRSVRVAADAPVRR